MPLLSPGELQAVLQVLSENESRSFRSISSCCSSELVAVDCFRLVCAIIGLLQVSVPHACLDSRCNWPHLVWLSAVMWSGRAGQSGSKVSCATTLFAVFVCPALAVLWVYLQFWLAPSSLAPYPCRAKELGGDACCRTAGVQKADCDPAVVSCFPGGGSDQNAKPSAKRFLAASGEGMPSLLPVQWVVLGLRQHECCAQGKAGAFLTAADRQGFQAAIPGTYLHTDL